MDRAAKPGTTWTHLINKKQYIVLMNCWMKVRQGSLEGWVPGIVYAPYGKSDETYCRSERDFLEKFA